MLQQITLGGTMIALPIYLQMVLEYDAMQAGLPRAALVEHVRNRTARRKASGTRRPSIIRAGFALLTVGMLLLIPIVPRADSGWYLLPSLVIAGTGLGLLVSQLNNYTLAPISEERVSEAAGVNSAAGSFGLSPGLAFAGAIMLATLSIAFTDMAQASTVPAGRTATRRAGAGRGRRSDEQHPARRASSANPRTSRPRSSASTRTHGHGLAGGATRADPRQSHRAAQLVPDGAPARPHAIQLGRRAGPGLSCSRRVHGRRLHR